MGLVIFEEDTVFRICMLVFFFCAGICEPGVCLLVEFFSIYFHYLQPSPVPSFSSDACNIQERDSLKSHFPL